MAKHILITGGAGFIGSHLADYLLAQGHHISIVDNLYLGSRKNIHHLEENPSFRFYKFDLLNRSKTIKLFLKEKFDIVFHLAANSDIGNGIKDRDLDYRLNLETTKSVLESMVAGNCKKIVLASTSAVYEPSNQPLSEEGPRFLPVSFYGASKLAAEGCVSAYSHAYGIQGWIFRFANVVGGRATHGVTLNFIKALKKNSKELLIFSDGQQLKPYIHVHDLIRGMDFCVRRMKQDVNCINIGVSSRITVNNIAKIIASEMKLNPKFKYTHKPGWPGDVQKYSFDLTKIKKLGWRAKLTSTQAVRKAVKELLN